MYLGSIVAVDAKIKRLTAVNRIHWEKVHDERRAHEWVGKL